MGAGGGQSLIRVSTTRGGLGGGGAVLDLAGSPQQATAPPLGQSLSVTDAEIKVRCPEDPETPFLKTQCTPVHIHGVQSALVLPTSHPR